MKPLLKEDSLLRRFGNWLHGLWPHVPVGIAVVLCGLMNVLGGLSQSIPNVASIEPLVDFEASMEVFGRSSQVFLGAFLIIDGIGLLWRLAVAWSFTFFLLVVTVVFNFFQSDPHVTFYLPSIMLVATWFWRRHFSRRTAGANYFFSLIGLFAVLAYGSLGSYLLGAGFKPRIETILDSFYFTIVTISTVGYGDISPATDETRVFVISLIIVGLGIFATITASVLGPALSGELARLFRPEDQGMELTNHVILAGDGPISTNAAQELESKGIDFVQIAPEPVEGAGVHRHVITGNACEESVLVDAGVRKARLVIASHDDDGENAFISLVSKDLNPKILILAVASSEKAIPRLKLARADAVFAPHVLGGRLLVDLAMGKQIAQEHQDLLDSVGGLSDS